MLTLALTAGLAAGLSNGLSLTPCHVDDIARRVECGRLTVPTHHDAPDGPTLEMAFIRLPAESATPAADPVIVLPGGPGQSGGAIVGIASALLARVGNTRDILVIDPRGTGESGKLACPVDPQDVVISDAAIRRQVNACYERLAADHDLTAYSSMAVADDVDALRAALGYETVNLWGGSWGTRTALVYARRHGEHLRAMVLDSVAPTDWAIGASMASDAQIALDRIVAACGDQPACANAFPTLGRRFEEMLNALDADTPDARVSHPLTGRPERVDINSLMLGSTVRGMLYSDTLIRILPYTVWSAWEGNYQPLYTASYMTGEQALDDIAFGMMLSVLCSEDIGINATNADSGAEAAAFLGTQMTDFWSTACADWPRHDLPADFHTPVTSDVPTLLIAGTWDPVTPPATAHQAAETLSRSRVIVVPAAGHIAGLRGCLPKLAATFIDTADPSAPDAGCVDDIAAKPFFVDALGPGAPPDSETTAETSP